MGLFGHRVSGSDKAVFVEGIESSGDVACSGTLFAKKGFVHKSTDDKI